MRRAAFLIALVVAAACAAPSSTRPPVAASGPPEVGRERIEVHAEQFEEIGARPAGSQEEQAASVYVTAHLQRAGYVIFLDGVPVADLIRSTNVVARAPSGEEPAAVVVAAYDTSAADAGGLAPALLLELARATAAAAPGHDIAFAAVGAEHAADGGGRLGSRRLVRSFLQDAGMPEIVVLEPEPGKDCVSLSGDELLEDFVDPTRACPAEEGSPGGSTAEVFAAAGFEVVAAGGGASETGRVVFDYLVSLSR